MAIDQNGRSVRCVQPVGVYDWMAGGGNYFNALKPDASQMTGQPPCALFQIIGVFGLRANRRKANETLQLLNEVRAITESWRLYPGDHLDIRLRRCQKRAPGLRPTPLRS